jgi:hypothetical protein
MGHTLVKGQRDNGHPAATYAVTGKCHLCCTPTLTPPARNLLPRLEATVIAIK